MPIGPDYLSSAIEDYYLARRRATVQDILARFTGKPTNLLSFDEIRRKLKAHTFIDRGVQDIPLDAILGSVNRYQDFTRGFLPRQAIGKDRWANVALLATKQGLPPIDVYRIGEIFFVKDGNHRVSAARHLGWSYIQAHVEEVVTHVPLTPDSSPDGLILTAEHAGFMELTRLPEVCPGAHLELTAPGQYARLEEHIAAHLSSLDPQNKLNLPFPEVVAHWYENAYLPVARYIEETGILRDFPGRTVADLYLWLVEHRQALEGEFGQEIRPEAAARHLVDRFSPRPRRVVSRLGRKLRKIILPQRFETGPAPGDWRKGKMSSFPEQRSAQRLFSDILVTVSGKMDGWSALYQALKIALREGARLHGLHRIESEEKRESPETRAIETEFNLWCAEAGVQADITSTAGALSERVWEQARWNDLVVVNLTYPPAPHPFATLGPGFRALVQRCPRPLLAVPRKVSALTRVLLAYDGSPKAREALYIAAYLAGEWKLPLVVLTAFEKDHTSREISTDAWKYLESHEIDASYVQATGPVIQEILITSEEKECDLILMGGYGHHPTLIPVLGNTVDQVLREARKPVLICR